MYTIHFFIIIFIIVLFFIIDNIITYLNNKHASTTLPKELEWIYSKEEYKKSREYEIEKSKFSKISWMFSFITLLVVLFLWLFWYIDSLIREFTNNEFLITIYFFGILFLVQTILNIPFSYYQTFVIEEKFGFNKMTKKLFVIDTIKSTILTLILGFIILSVVLFLYSIAPNTFWIYAWIFISFVSVFMMMFYSSLIVPLFNKQTPLEEWELRNAIEDFSNKVWFKIDNIYVIDGSKRSKKANAYFSWFWPKKRIVLFDTLINELTKEELVAVLAHEIGHYKKKHTLWMLAFSIIQTWVLLFIFSLIIDSQNFANALGSTYPSFHLWMIAFMIIITPISFVFWILFNLYSRKNEYEADDFAKQNYSWAYLASALKKLSKNNLSNLTPHPIYEFVHYSHPWVLKRLDALEK